MELSVTRRSLTNDSSDTYTYIDTRILTQMYSNTVATGGARPPGANVFVAAPNTAIRSPIVILMVTTMALVWTVNSTLNWGVKFQNSIFLPLQMPPPAQCHPLRMPPPPPFRRH